MTKNILITGANGGIGSAIALVAAKAGYGYNIGLHYHTNSENIDKIKKQLTEYPIQISTYRADIANEDDIKNMYRVFITNHSCLYALI